MNVRTTACTCASGAGTTHGAFEALVYSDARMWFDSQRFNKPGTIPLQTRTEVEHGCPLDCGFCPEHKQHEGHARGGSARR